MKLRVTFLAVLLVAVPTVATAGSMPRAGRASARLTIAPHCNVVGKKTTFKVVLTHAPARTRYEFFRGPLANLPQQSQALGVFRTSKQGTLGLYMPVHYTTMSSSIEGKWSVFVEPPGTRAITGDGTPHAHFKIVAKSSQC